MTGKKNNVLIIEDSQATAILLKDFLNKLGYQDIANCTNGKDGIDLFRKLTNSGKNPTVLLDFQLPDMNANEIMESIFKIRPNAKIILETADDKSEEKIKSALRGGAYQYIQKPIRYENLKTIFETLEQEGDRVKEIPLDNLEKILAYSHRISFARLSEYCNMDKDQLMKYLTQFEKENKIMKVPDMREISCSQCGSLRILPNFFCPACNSNNFEQGKLIEHFKCGNVSVEKSYKENICPKCNKEIKILGVDYKSLDNYYICNDCGDKFPTPSEDYVCLKCNNSFTLEKAKWVNSPGYMKYRASTV